MSLGWVDTFNNVYQQITCSCSLGAICIYCSLLHHDRLSLNPFYLLEKFFYFLVVRMVL